MPPQPTDIIRTISIRELIPDPILPPRILVPERVSRLATDIEAHGLLEPLRARPPIDADSPYRVLQGRRRLAAMRESGLCSATVIITDGSDDRMILCHHVTQNQSDPASPLETAWMTARMVDTEAEAGTEAPQRAVALWLRAHVGTGSEATVARRMKIAARLSPEWLDGVGIPMQTLTRLSQTQLLDVAEISDDDERADALRIAAGLLPAPAAPSPPRFVCNDRAGGWGVSMSSPPSEEWPDEDLGGLIDVLEPLVATAYGLRDVEPPALVEARIHRDAEWAKRTAVLIDALEDAYRERDAARRMVQAYRIRRAGRIMAGLRIAARRVSLRLSTWKRSLSRWKGALPTWER